MPRPYLRIAEVQTPEGPLSLHRRGEEDFLLLIDGRVLMTSALRTSEEFLAEAGCQTLVDQRAPRLLIGGLGLGFTLQAALTQLPRSARVTVCELNAAVIEWCKGPVRVANGEAALDPRVSFVEGDVTKEIARLAGTPDEPRYDAILWDLYVGPTRLGQDSHPLYGHRSMKNTRDALSSKGVFGVWCEEPSPAFEQRLQKAGFSVHLTQTKGRGLRHAVYLAKKG